MYPAAHEHLPDLRHHIKDEANDLLPKLQQACSQEQLHELGHMVTKAKEAAPHHPHPGAPDKPPANRSSALVPASLTGGATP